MNAMAIILALMGVAVRLDPHGDPSIYSWLSAYSFFIGALVVAGLGMIFEYRERDK